MTAPELFLMALLAQAWEAYCELPKNQEDGFHHDDVRDFLHHIHALQNIVASRPSWRAIRAAEENERKKG